MTKKPLETMEEHFGKVVDPRQERTEEHKRIDSVIIAICAELYGAEGWVDIELYGRSKLPWLRTFLELPNGIGSLLKEKKIRQHKFPGIPLLLMEAFLFQILPVVF